MSDLISRSALIEYFTVDGYIPNFIEEAINLQPTAYDVDAVVEEVQNVHLPLASQTSRIVNIIRKGGIE